MAVQQAEAMTPESDKRPLSAADMPVPKGSSASPAIAGEGAGVQAETRHTPDGEIFFHAERRSDGTYSLTLTEEGLEAFETALGIARDLGGRRRISAHSTITDIMDRTAIREELSAALRQEARSSVHMLRVAVLRRMLWGSEEPAPWARFAGHVGKVLIIGLLLLWALLQLLVAIGDVAAIPGILAHIPEDILHLDPTASIARVGRNISDAGTHLLFSAAGVCLAFITAALIRPFARIYRNDQIVPGSRLLLRGISRLLRRLEARSTAA